jgi:predicted secreted protein
MAQAGKKLRIAVATTQAGTYTNVAGLKNGTHNIAGANQDVSAFGVDWVQRIQGLKDGKLTLSGQYEPTDTLGQIVIRSALISDSLLFYKFLPATTADGTSGFQQAVKVASFQVTGPVDGVQQVTIELEGDGAITIV